MKFLTISTVKDVFYSIPKAEREKVNAAMTEFFSSYLKTPNRKVHFYSDPEGTFYSIGEYDSVEQYYQGLMMSPRAAAGYTNFKCIPLIEWDEKSIKAYLARSKAAKK